MRTVMSIGAHPDDIEIGCGGTELILKQKGYRLVHIIATNGEEGSLSISPEELRARRQDEARNAAAIIGVDALEFLDLPDGLTHFSKESKVQLIKHIRTYAPDIVFTHSSSDHFPDHAVVHQLTCAAMEAAKGPWYPEGGNKPHRIAQVFGYEVWHPLNRHQLAVDISPVMERKILALKEHFSQTGEVNYISAIDGLARFRGAMTMLGQFAEVFEVIQSDCSAVFAHHASLEQQLLATSGPS